jgi:beta-N-acetylhexosaminidase
MAAAAILVVVLVANALSDGGDHAGRGAGGYGRRVNANSPAGVPVDPHARRKSPNVGGRSSGEAQALGEMIVARMSGASPSASLLARIRAGEVGGVILFAESFAQGLTRASATIAELQSAAKVAGTWPLLVMTDQEGGEIRRIANAPPALAPRYMTSVALARREGERTGQMLKRVGVNVDLAPVADVERSADSFLGPRSFGGSPGTVAARACAFAAGLSHAGVGYALKHFPGLGAATSNTDLGPVVVRTPASTLRADYAAYRLCGRAPRTLVMVSNAIYPTLTGTYTPAVLSRHVLSREIRMARIEAVTISDDLQAGALTDQRQPALHAVDAGLDLLLYAQTEAASADAFVKLSGDLATGRLRAGQVRKAALAIARLKASLVS